MKILLDESVPIQVGKAFSGHEVFTVSQMGWGGYSNGDLLVAARGSDFKVLTIADKNFRHQQNLSGLPFTILELWTNHRPTLELHLIEIREAVENISSVGYIILEHPLPPITNDRFLNMRSFYPSSSPQRRKARQFPRSFYIYCKNIAKNHERETARNIPSSAYRSTVGSNQDLALAFMLALA
jgi:predicted nuclease of predicted toxin-antitoxin system